MSEIIDFAKWLTGHDEETIRQMYEDFKKHSSPPEAVGEQTTAANKYIKFLEEYWGIPHRITLNPETEKAQREYRLSLSSPNTEKGEG